MNLDLARWQFGITTVYHFLFVPITIGLGFLVAGLQTAWVRTDKEKYLRGTKFFGRLFLINFAMGVVTGIVQEFQFGMNWSDYSRFGGDIFGAPLAIEGLLAFFLESVFLGLWIFGWDRLPKKLHLATIWMASLGTALSAYFILAANAFMQHPVGYIYNAETGRAELVDFFAVLTQNTAVSAFVHTMSFAFFTAGAFMAGISAWLLVKGKSVDVVKSTMRLGVITTIVAFIAIVISGDYVAKIMVQQQPMKMAAAEALYETTDAAPFSLFTIGTLDGSRPVFQIDVPNVTSFMATGSFNGEVKGINNLQAEYVAKYGEGNYKPNIPIAYWTFRLMIGLGTLAFLFAVYALYATRGNRRPTSIWFARGALALPVIPLLANSAGWIFTELGRQPWAVFGLMKTADGVSPNVTVPMLLTTLIGFTFLYGILAVVEVSLLAKAVKLGPSASSPITNPKNVGGSDTKELTFTY